MGLIVILVWFGDFVKRHGGSNNFRSGLFDSRLASGNSRFGPLREFSRNTLISLSFSQANGGFRRGSAKFPAQREKAGNSAPINATLPEDAPILPLRAGRMRASSDQLMCRCVSSQPSMIRLNSSGRSTLGKCLVFGISS